MAQEMFLRKIPEDMQPWECNVNGVKYVYPAGTEQNVPAEVAAIIDAYWENQEVDYPETGISFNDLRDRPFYESMEVVFDQRVELANEGYVLSEALAISDGDHVKVTWDGTEYECTAVQMQMDADTTAVVVGNIYGEGSAPFVIAVIPSAGMTQIVESSGFIGVIPVKIEKSVIHTIDPKFLPGGGVLLYADDNGYLHKSDVFSEENAVSMDEVLGYAKKGMTVVVTPYAIGERTDYQYAATIIKITTEEPNYARVFTGGSSYYHSKERVYNEAPPV